MDALLEPVDAARALASSGRCATSARRLNGPRSRGRGSKPAAAAAGRRRLDHPSPGRPLSRGIRLGLDLRGARQPHPWRFRRRIRSGPRGRLGRRARRRDRRLDFPHEERRSRGRQTQAALCRAKRPRSRPRPHAGRDMRRSRARTRLPRAHLMDQRLLVAARRIYQAAGFRLVERSAAPFVRP